MCALGVRRRWYANVAQGSVVVSSMLRAPFLEWCAKALWVRLRCLIDARGSMIDVWSRRRIHGRPLGDVVGGAERSVASGGVEVQLTMSLSRL